jgi:hypothetical protein
VTGLNEALCTATIPSPLSAETTSPEAAPGADQRRLGTPGWRPPAGYTATAPVVNPPATAAVRAPDDGTPPCPVTGTVIVWPAPIRTWATRAPVSAPNAPAADGAPDSQ